jgi:hypothetical protein
MSEAEKRRSSVRNLSPIVRPEGRRASIGPISSIPSTRRRASIRKVAPLNDEEESQKLTPVNESTIKSSNTLMVPQHSQGEESFIEEEEEVPNMEMLNRNISESHNSTNQVATLSLRDRLQLWIVVFTKWYYQNVTFQLESWLHIIFLIPFSLAGGLLLYIRDGVTFPTKTDAVVMLGIINLHSYNSGPWFDWYEGPW